MLIQAGSKFRNARLLANLPVANADAVNLLDRISILAGLLFTLSQSSPSEADDKPVPAEEVASSDQPASDDHGATAAPLEIAHLPGDQMPADGQEHAAAPTTEGTDYRVAAEPGTQNIEASMLDILPKSPAVKPPAHHGSSTSPAVLNIEVIDDTAGSAALSMQKLIVATPISDVVVSNIPSTTFAFTGLAGPNNFDVFIGTGNGNTVDFSGLDGLVNPTKSNSAESGSDPKSVDSTGTQQDHSAPNGVLVDLSAQGQTVNSAVGPVTVQAWQLDGDGKAEIPLAHLENIDNVVGTVGNDVVIGNDNANTFTYTASDGAGGQSASYGFDIYYGGAPAGNDASDTADRADFSRLGPEASVATGDGPASTALPDDAQGITVDLAQSVTISTVDPHTGEATTVTGSVVSTVGGSESTDLAMLAWTEGGDGSPAHGTIEQIVGSGGSDAIRGDGADNTFVVTGDGESGASLLDGRAGVDTVDFSRVSASSNAEAPAAAPATAPAAAPVVENAAAASSASEAVPTAAEASVTDTAPAGDVIVPDGVYVNLSSTEHTADSSVGPVTVQAWTIDAEGKADAALAHVENVETVVGTTGSDVIVGNDDANTFVYTAEDDAHVDATGQVETGPEASYGFDVYAGGDTASSPAADTNDTADFSMLGSQASVEAAVAAGVDQALLPNGGTGITVDLAESVTITTVDPETGDLTQVTGSLVSTVGGSEQTDLALLAWSAQPDGDASSTIENIVTSGGSDAIWGDAADNTVVVSGSSGPSDASGPSSDGSVEDLSGCGAVFFDGRDGDDTIDFSRLGEGIEIHLNQTQDGVTDPTGGTQSDVSVATSVATGETVAAVTGVENVVGSSGNDVIEGNQSDNSLAGGGGSDAFVFSDVAVVDGRGVTNIGHDIIKDFHRAGTDDDDILVFDSSIFNFHDGSNLDWLQEFVSNYVRNSDMGTIIWIDDDNSITLQNYCLQDHSGPGDGLGAYSSWIVFV